MHNIPTSERPRERLIAHGAEALTSTELIAILFGSGSSGRSSIAVAADLLASVGGSLRYLASRPLPSMRAVKGIGSARAISIQAALELGKRMVHESPPKRIQVNRPSDVAELYSPRLENLNVEQLHVATVDSQHRIISDVLVTRGILNASLAHPREVFRHAIAENAFAIILIHNHPSGDPTPSSADISLTTQLRESGDILGIPVLDHVIIGRRRFSSFMELGIFK